MRLVLVSFTLFYSCIIITPRAHARARGYVIVITPRAHARARGYVIGRVYYILSGLFLEPIFYLQKYSL